LTSYKTKTKGWVLGSAAAWLHKWIHTNSPQQLQLFHEHRN